jgi:hypothetical protein
LAPPFRIKKLTNIPISVVPFFFFAVNSMAAIPSWRQFHAGSLGMMQWLSGEVIDHHSLFMVTAVNGEEVNFIYFFYGWNRILSSAFFLLFLSPTLSRLRNLSPMAHVPTGIPVDSFVNGTFG